MAGRHFLRTYAGLDVGSPNEVIRTCREVGILTVEETEYALEMANDRNLTSHTYDLLWRREFSIALPAMRLSWACG